MEQLGYIAIGAVLVLTALGLRRIRWSGFRLPGFGSGKSAWTPRTKNAILLSIALHAMLAMIGALFIVTQDVEYDAITVEWVNLPRTLRQLKKTGSQTHPASNHAPSKGGGASNIPGGKTGNCEGGGKAFDFTGRKEY